MAMKPVARARLTAPFGFRPDSGDLWLKGAVCAEDGAASMFPNPGDDQGVEAARRNCDRCPVRAACLETALDRGEQFGIWGGATPDERRAMRRREVRRAAAQNRR